MASGDLTGTTSSPQYLPAAVFDGVDDYIEIPHSVRQLGANLTNGFTISAWIKPRTSGESGGKIIDKSDSDGGFHGFTWYLWTDNILYFKVNNITNLESTNTVTLNTWTHVLLTYTAAASFSLYVNGTFDRSESGSAISTITSSNAIRIGNRSTATDRTWDGSIAKVKMWNRVLTAAEIADDYAGKAVPTGIIMHYKLDGDAKDSSQFANDGTVSGAYFTNVAFNNIVADVRERNLAAATDKLLILPGYGRNDLINVFSANRTA